MWLDTSVPETTTNGPAARLEKGDSTMETFAVSVIAADEADRWACAIGVPPHAVWRDDWGRSIYEPDDTEEVPA